MLTVKQAATELQVVYLDHLQGVRGREAGARPGVERDPDRAARVARKAEIPSRR
jgi:hypothetical protein